MLRAVLVDVGGTLWPDVWPETPDDDFERAAQLRNAIPSVSESDAHRLVRALETPHPLSERQETRSMVATALRNLNLRTDVDVSAVAAAMCLPARGRISLFPGGADLVRGLARRDLRVVIVSNVVWRDGASYRGDFDELDLSDYAFAFVTSLEVGWRKPHDAFFDAALAAAGVPAEECAMVGDDEVNDIVPAHSRGMLTLRVSIDRPSPEHSVADHTCTSLAEVTRLLNA